MIGVTLRACRPQSALGCSRQPQTSQSVCLSSGSLVIAAFMIGKMVVLTIDVTIRCIDSSSPGQYHENRGVLFRPTLFPAMSGSTQAMVTLNGLTRKSSKESQHTFISEDLWPKVSSSSTSECTHHQEEQKKHQGDKIHTNMEEFPLLVGVSSIVCFFWRRPTLLNSSSASFCFWPLRLVSTSMNCVQSNRIDTRWLIPVTLQSIRRFHCSGPAPSLLLMLMDWAVSQTCSLTLWSFCCVVKPPFPCQIPMVSVAHWLTPTPVFSAHMRTCRVSIWIESASAMIDFGNQKASHYILCPQQWSRIE